jgi:hypothetical protein
VMYGRSAWRAVTRLGVGGATMRATGT